MICNSQKLIINKISNNKDNYNLLNVRNNV